MQETEIYQKDLIGTKTLDESGRISKVLSDCTHANHPQPPCKHIYEAYSAPLLNQVQQQAWVVFVVLTILNSLGAKLRNTTGVITSASLTGSCNDIKGVGETEHQ